MKKTLLIAMLSLASINVFSAGCKSVFDFKTGSFKLVCGAGPNCKNIFDYKTGKFTFVCK